MVKFDGLKDFDVAALGRNAPAAAGAPRDLPMHKIHPDPDNIRTSCDEASIAELAETIQADGLLQAITVREHPQKPGCYLICYGERRWRAFQLLGRAAIPAVINNSFDPYRQAIENLQREELTPIQLAQFIAKREAAGDGRAKIAKRLGKSKSFISELAQLATAPQAVKAAFEGGRIDTRTAYLLARHYPAQPDRVMGWLTGDAPVTRLEVTQGLITASRSAEPMAARSGARARGSGAKAPSYNALAVLAAGREATMHLQPGDSVDRAVVRFSDGSQEAVALSKITLKAWTKV